MPPPGGGVAGVAIVARAGTHKVSESLGFDLAFREPVPEEVLVVAGGDPKLAEALFRVS